MIPPNLKSMTGFGRAEAQTPLGHFAVELKSVNSRFLEAKAFLPPLLSALEHELKGLLQSRVRRGKLDCRVRFSIAGAHARPAQFNEGVIRDYLGRSEELRERLGLEGEALGLEALLRLPGALDAPEEETDLGPYWEALTPVVNEALDRFDEERGREGAALGNQMLEELVLLRARRGEVEAQRSAVLQRYRDKLIARIGELSEEVRGKLDPGRLELEVTLYADRCDVAEEMVRLESHLSRLEALIGNRKGEPVGKALDFLIQEILREVNTTSSKLRDLDAVSAVLEMKGSVERLREQVQNLE